MFGFALWAISAPTTFDAEWDMSGGVNWTVVNGDDSFSTFGISGNHAFGEYHAIDYDDNPYGYNVDSTKFWLKANVENGGYIEYAVTRTDSKTSMYGPPGQYTYSYVGSSDGSAFMGQRTTTNYAEQKNCNYGWQSNNQYTADGTSFYLDHEIYASSGEGAGVNITGSGSASVTVMGDEMYPGSFNLGYKACGCYTNAKASGTGSGIFTLGGTADNSLTWYGGSAGGGTYTTTVNYLDGFQVDNIWLKGN